MLIRPVESSDIVPLLDMLQKSGQFDDEGYYMYGTLSKIISLVNQTSYGLALNKKVSQALHIAPQKL
jgi:hypothetical protein